MPAARGARADLVESVLNIVKDDGNAREERSDGSSGCDRRAKWDLRHQSGRPRAAGSGGSGCSGLAVEGARRACLQRCDWRFQRHSATQLISSAAICLSSVVLRVEKAVAEL